MQHSAPEQFVTPFLMMVKSHWLEARVLLRDNPVTSQNHHHTFAVVI
jgi:hypothetical protein